MIRDWRGTAKATPKGEVTKLFNFLKVSKKDSFCDLGCGYGHLCIHACKWVSKSAGFETHKQRYKTAKRKIQKSKIQDIQIFNQSYEHQKSFKFIKNYNIIFCVNGVTKDYLKKLEKILERNSKIILYDLPPPPIKPNKKLGWYFILQTPYSQANSEKEWIFSVTKRFRKRNELFKMIRNNFRKDYKVRIDDILEELNKVFGDKPN